MISEHAIIDPSAKLGKNVKVGPWTIIGPNVEIGDDCEILSHVVISANTKMGKRNKIYSFAAVGGDPQDIHFEGEETFLEMGDDNTVREYVTINRGSSKGTKLTKIGNKNAILAYAHIAHDCEIGNEVLLVNHATLAGHVIVDDFAVVGAFTAVHQYSRIGSYSFTSRGAKINRDVLPYTLVTGALGEPRGLNLVGLQRRGFSQDQIRVMKRAYSLVYKRGMKQDEILQQLREIAKEHPEVLPMLEWIEQSERGYIR